MHNPARTRTYQLLAALLLMNVSACGWVDSTGVQGTTVAVALRNAQPVAIIELVQILENSGYEIATEITSAANFWTAEDYHQDYFDNHGTGYSCHTRVNRFTRE